MRSRGGAGLGFLSYHKEEDGPVITGGDFKGCFLNKHAHLFDDTSGTPKPTSLAGAAQKQLYPGDKHLIVLMDTVEASHFNPLAQKKGLPFPANVPAQVKNYDHGIALYVPPATRQKADNLIAAGVHLEVKILLFFGTGTEMTRHGLRFFADNSPDCVFINVPGVEARYDFVPKGANPWGVGITMSQIRHLLDRAFPKYSVDFVVDRMIGFSTGYLGWSDTIRNDLVDLRRLRGAFLFDCLYPEQRIAAAIAKVRQSASMARIACYAASGAGSPSGPAILGKLGLRFDELITLFGSREYQALTHLRILAAGLHDGTVASNDIDPAYLAELNSLISTLPARGSVYSSASAFQALHGKGPPKSATTAGIWFSANSAKGKTFLRRLWKDSNNYDALIRLIWKHELVGWSGGYDEKLTQKDLDHGALSEGAHDFFPPEYTWECMRQP
ncbi:hypothetical protein [Microvirga antarctica]|uniref:hypothetical protein n=1 Tax=Microvirga antarctica TaxID=2819233 RepID=UPI001B316C85|nr:hypothetical protein [Microvirga antarctica]